MSNWDEIKYFAPYEFDSPDMPDSGKYVDIELVKKLDLIRAQYGRRIVVNSGYRTAQHNKDCGGAEDSAHLRGKAADIRCWSSEQRFKLLRLAYEHGFRRIGIAKSFIHLDIDESLPSGIVYLY